MSSPPPAAGTRKRFWVTGANGLIGNAIVCARPAVGDWGVVPLTRNDLDLLDPLRVEERFTHERPDGIVHCAAMSRSPECQAQPRMARAVNFEATRHLADLAAGIPFIFFSTDLVFDGKKGRYGEADSTFPQSVYAETKLAAEEVVLANPNHTVIRTTLTFGQSPTGDRSVDEELILHWRRGDTTNLFDDEFRSPIPAQITARAVWELIRSRGTGLYHLGGNERLSRWEIGTLVAEDPRAGEARIHRGSLQDYRGAPRSPDTSLDSSKIQSLLPFALPRISDWFRSHHQLR